MLQSFLWWKWWVSVCLWVVPFRTKRPNLHRHSQSVIGESYCAIASGAKHFKWPTWTVIHPTAYHDHITIDNYGIYFSAYQLNLLCFMYCRRWRRVYTKHFQPNSKILKTPFKPHRCRCGNKFPTRLPNTKSRTVWFDKNIRCKNID